MTAEFTPGRLAELLGVSFTAEQLAAITAPLAPGCVVAGAGSGKTTVMAARVVWLVGSGQLRPEQVLGLTFTNKAAAELAVRIRDALRRAGPLLPTPVAEAAGDVVVADQPTDGEPSVATYHAYAGRLLREHGLWIGVEPGARLLADATRFQVADRVLRRAEGPFDLLDKTVSPLVGDLVELDGELNEHLVDLPALLAEDDAIVLSVAGAKRPTQRLEEVSRTARERSQLATLVAALRDEKARLGVLDFGDQLAEAARLVRTHPAVGEIERDRFRVVLLDEYQDTSVAQVLLLSDLFGGGHPVTAVGDPCQAIYGWRGASVRGIDDFPVQFPRADGRPAVVYPLTQNNRSGGRLLDLANDLAAPLRERHPEVEALVPRADLAGLGSVRCGLFTSYADEVAWVTDGIAREIESGTAPRDIAVLVRVRSDFAAYHDALVARGVPVEVVGLGGLLALPEVADLVAMLKVLDDPTANASLVRLLSGPRWRIGIRDLVALGRHARKLVRDDRHDASGQPAAEVGELDGDGDGELGVEELLEAAVEGVDPAEIVSLSEAMDRLGGIGCSVAARERFARFAAELRTLRRHLGDPLLDLLQRVAQASGLDVEVGAAPYGPRTRRGEALGAFLEQAAAFSDLEGDPSVRAFLAFLRAAEDFERGLDTTAPSPGDSVKLLTLHKAKGLEWPVVVLPNLTADVFPAKRGRSRWTTSLSTLPFSLRGDAADFPTVGEWSNKGLDGFLDSMRRIDQLEELRLAYVGVTRAKTRLVASSHWWGPTQKNPRGPSPFLLTIQVHAEQHGGVAHWEPQPPEEQNPRLLDAAPFEWPVPLAAEPLDERRRAAGWVRAARAALDEQLPLDLVTTSPPPAALATAEQAIVEGWDRDLAALLDEARRSHRVDLDIPLPASLSASALVRLASDPDGLAHDLARPMPRPPAPAATRGTRFHAWVESLFGELPLLDRFDLEGAADDDLVPDEALGSLQAAFLAGPYAARPPHRVEAPFQLVLGGRVIRGRIDAVYRTDDGYDVIDWKTGRGSADPLQLAVYRAAWARIAGVPESSVGAAFYYVATGRIERPADLPGAAELEQLLTAETA